MKPHSAFDEKNMAPDELLDLWHAFDDIPINDRDEIEEPFMDFSTGTNRFDVWHWFDERWPGGVYDLLFL